MAGRKRRKTYRRWLQTLKKAGALIVSPRSRRTGTSPASAQANVRVGGKRIKLNIRRRRSRAGKRFSRRISRRDPKRARAMSVVLAAVAIAVLTALMAGRFLQALPKELPQEEFDNGRWTLLWARLWGDGQLTSAEKPTPDVEETEDAQRKEAQDVQVGAETAKSACRFGPRMERRQTLSETGKIRQVAQGQTAAILEALPKELSAQRRQFVEAALSLVGEVEYRWGGKTPQEGMDCSGFTAWVFGLAESTAAQQREACREIEMEQAKPGDLAFYDDASHVGIVVGCSEEGDIWVCHCASGQNTVVVTKAQESGFTQVGWPAWLSER